MTDRKFALKLLGILAAVSSEFQLNNPIYGDWRKMPFGFNAGSIAFACFFPA